MQDMKTIKIIQRRPPTKELFEKRLKEGNRSRLKLSLLYCVDVLKVKPELVSDPGKRKSLIERIERHIKKNLVPKHSGGEYIILVSNRKLCSIHF